MGDAKDQNQNPSLRGAGRQKEGLCMVHRMGV